MGGRLYLGPTVQPLSASNVAAISHRFLDMGLVPFRWQDLQGSRQVFLLAMGQTFYDIEAHGDKKNGNHRCGQHATNDSRAQDSTRNGSRACSRPQRHASENEGK